MISEWLKNIGAAQWACICLIAALILAGIIAALADFISDFSRELRYLNCEIRRTTGEDRKFWIRERRRLWLSWIPFVKY